jgi:multidrug efflux pump subunit AcrA (membrane-fusion protein)
MAQRVLTIILILAVVFFGGFYAYNELMPKEVVESQGPTYVTHEVKKDDISVGVDVSGRLEGSWSREGSITAPGNRQYDGPSFQYIIDDVVVEQGDAVTKGQLLIKLKAPDLQEKIKTEREKLAMRREELSDITGVRVAELGSINPAKGVTIKADIGGRITNLDAKEGDEIETGKSIGRIVDDSKFKVRAKLFSSEIKSVKVDQKVLLSFSIFDGFTEAKIIDINTNATPDIDKDGKARGFVYWITIEAENPGLVQPDMEVRVGLPADEDNTYVNYFANKAKVEGFIKEKRIINRIDGIVTEVFVHDMEILEVGTPIATMAGSDTQEKIQEKVDEIWEIKSGLEKMISQVDELEIFAGIDGVIGNIQSEIGETVDAGRYIGEIINTSEMSMSAMVDDRDLIYVQEEAPVNVVVDALPGAVLEGKVVYVDTWGEEINGITKYRVGIEVKGNSKLKRGMQANGHIEAGSAEGVLLVPIDAMYDENGKAKVEILNSDGTTKDVILELGLMNDRYAEVKSGIEEGNLVIMASSADILPSQSIKSKDSILPDKNDNGNGENENSDNEND